MLAALRPRAGGGRCPREVTIAGADGRGHASPVRADRSRRSGASRRRSSSPRSGGSVRMRGRVGRGRRGPPAVPLPRRRAALLSSATSSSRSRLRRLARARYAVLPFQFVAEIIPYYLGERYRYDARTARLEDIAGQAVGGDAGHAGRTACPTGSAPGTSSPSIPVTAAWIPGTRGSTFPAASGRRT